MKGIVLAGGEGIRLYPSTKTVSKQLLPVFDKPTIYYPVSLLMLAGIREICIISTPRDLPLFKELLGNGSQFGVSFTYLVQKNPAGIPQAYTIAEKFISGQKNCMVLGDNLFYGNDLYSLLNSSFSKNVGASIFTYRVLDPSRFGVVEFNKKGQVISLKEKPVRPKSSWAVTGLYVCDGRVSEYVKKLKPSKRGELEIVDLMNVYRAKGQLNVELFGRGVAWLDTGTHESLLQSSTFVQTIEQRQGLKIGCLEEVALNRGFISKKQFSLLAKKYPASSYGDYLRRIVSLLNENQPKR